MWSPACILGRTVADADGRYPRVQSWAKPFSRSRWWTASSSKSWTKGKPAPASLMGFLRSVFIHSDL